MRVLDSLAQVLARIYQIKKEFALPPVKDAAAPKAHRVKAAVSDAPPVKFKQNLSDIIAKASKKYSLTPELISSIIKQESGFNSSAVSPKGAKGLMQLMPKTAAELGVKNILDPEENVMAGTKYLRNLLDIYKGNMKAALSAYNAGPGNVDANQNVPNIKETREYLKRVLKDYYG